MRSKIYLLLSVLLLSMFVATAKMSCPKTFAERALERMPIPSAFPKPPSQSEEHPRISLANPIQLRSSDPWQNANQNMRPWRDSDNDSRGTKILIIAGGALLAIGIALYFLADAPMSTSGITTTTPSQKRLQIAGIIAAVIGVILCITASVKGFAERRDGHRGGNWYD